jgi:hypothetical protein
MKKHLIFLVFAGAIILTLSGSAFAADNDTNSTMNTTTINSYNHVYINVSNTNGVKYNFDYDYYLNNPTYNVGGSNGTYYIKAEGGGLNQLHITNNASNNYGQVTVINANGSSNSGTFYITTTGGRGFNDDIILLLSVEGPISDNFTMTLISSGYGNWTLATPGAYNPSKPTDYQYITGAVNETFTKEDFIYGPQTTRPSPGGWQPLYYGQTTSDNSTAAYFMFIDLYLGNIQDSSLIDGGSIKVDYNFTNLFSTASFNAYAWAIASNQGVGINWGNPTTGSSASVYTVSTPEISASNLQLPSNPVAGTNYSVNATITNNGVSNADAFVVKLYDNNVQVGKITLAGLAGKASTIVSFNWTPSTVGSHVLSVIADVNNQIIENNKTNNQITQTVTTIASSLPELTATNLQLPSNPVNGTTYTVNVTISNTGNSDAGAFVVKLYDNNTQIGKINLSGLSAGANTILNFNWTPNTVGDHVLSVIADANKQITETNRDNNQITQSTTTTASTLPDLTATDLQLPSNPVNGTTYPVTVTISNTGASDITSNFAVKLYDNNTQIQKITVANLAAGASTTLTFYWTPNTTGNHTLSVIADANKQLTEVNENNNQIIQNTTVS